MSPRLAVLTRFQRRLIYWTTFFLWGSGALWYYYDRFGRIHDQFGTSTSPMQPLILRLHGAAAMAFLLVFGSLVPVHMRPGWRQGDHRVSGGSMVGTSVILILTGWGLYYVGDEVLRRGTSLVHTYLGLALPLVLVLHVMITRSKRRHLAASSSTHLRQP